MKEIEEDFGSYGGSQFSEVQSSDGKEYYLWLNVHQD